MAHNRSPFVLWPLAIALLVAGCARPQAASPATPQPLPTAAASEERPGLAADFDRAGVQGSFVLYDAGANRYIRYNPGRSSQRFRPGSTFEFLSALVAVDSGVVADPDAPSRWDGTVYPNATWNRDHSLRSAFRDSVGWYDAQVAQRVGKERLQHAVEAAGYGNRDVSGPLTSFWLDGGLRISQEEQIDFLRRFYQGDLPFSKRAIDTVKEIAVIEQTEEYTLSGKTGLATMGEADIGWFVGYVERGGNVVYFATNTEGPKGDGRVPGSRMRITSDILQALGVLPEVCGKCQH